MRTKAQWVVAGLLGSVTALIVCPEVNGQFIVDAAGPRNVFFNASPSKGTNTLFSGISANVQTSSDPSVDLDYYHPIKRIILGLDVKATADNGISQFLKFNQYPQFNFSGIINYSFEAGSLYSFTGRFTEQYNNNDAIFDPTRPVGSQSYTRDWLGEAATFTFSYEAPTTSMLKDFGFAVGFGYATTNNLSSLPQVTIGALLSGSGTQTVVGSGKTVRFGTFNSYNSLPISFLPSYNCGEANWLRGFPYIPGWSLLSRTNTYEIIASPYGSYTPSDAGRPTDAIGLNLVLESVGPAPIVKGVPMFAYQSITFPLAIFIERPNAFLGKPSVTVGAALTYHFP